MNALNTAHHPLNPGLNDLACLCISRHSRFMQYLVTYFKRQRTRIHWFTPKNLETACHAIAEQAVSMMLSHVPDPASAGDSLSCLFPLKSACFPPLVIMTDRTPTAREYERFRLQGVAHVIAEEFDEQRDGPALQQLARANSWLNVDAMPLSEILQMLDRMGKPYMVTVTPPTMERLSPFAWDQKQATTMGRIFIEKGKLIHAETPDALGLEALIQMLAMPQCRIVAHPVFLRPIDAHSQGPLEENLLRAMVHIDEVNRSLFQLEVEFEAPTVTTEDQTPEPEPQWHDDILNLEEEPASLFPAREKEMAQATQIQKLATSPVQGKVSDLESILHCDASLRGIATADDQGNVLELEGVIDAETVCAVAAMCSQTIHSVGDLLGFGRARMWGTTSQNFALYQVEDHQHHVAIGLPSKNPICVLDRISSKII